MANMRPKRGPAVATPNGPPSSSSLPNCGSGPRPAKWKDGSSAVASGVVMAEPMAEVHEVLRCIVSNGLRYYLKIDRSKPRTSLAAGEGIPAKSLDSGAHGS